MIAEDIEHLKIQLIQISQNQNGQLLLSKETTNCLLLALQDYQDRVDAMEQTMCPHPELSAVGETKQSCSGSNVVVFPRKKIER
ncbi:MAG: hypothetical protein QGH69_05050 [Alphaproteobacteria bacterium]|jgi:hypothetical protein|nr:hypothetical protein [Alphaproteobacteria bacterium]